MIQTSLVTVGTLFTLLWGFITTQFRFSQEGVSQSWLFWTIVLGVWLMKKCWRNGFSKKS